MYIFHEGMPGSGKSYEAAVYRIIPALQKGRRVYARLNGIDYAKFAELAEISEERCRELLTHIESEDVCRFHNLIAEKNCLILLDELQNFFPASRNGRLDTELTTFVAEHRHHGHDIIGMGQNINDVHTFWKRRCQRKYVFTKLNALGTSKRYKWQAYDTTVDGKGTVIFRKTTSGIRSYDPKFFGCYASHNPENDNTEDFHDPRANIFNGNLFKFGIPCALVVAIWGLFSIANFFDGDKAAENFGGKAPVAKAAQAPKTLVTEVKETAVATVKPAPEKPKPVDGFDEIFDKHAIVRIAGYVQGEDGRTAGIIEAMDSSYHLQEVFTFEEVRAMGWKADLKTYGLEVTKNGKTRLIRMRPIDPFGAVATRTNQQVGGAGAYGASRDATIAPAPPHRQSEGKATWSNPGAGIGSMPVDHASDLYERGTLVQR